VQIFLHTLKIYAHISNKRNLEHVRAYYQLVNLKQIKTNTMPIKNSNLNLNLNLFVTSILRIFMKKKDHNTIPEKK
jgi:hypothetical protein